MPTSKLTNAKIQIFQAQRFALCVTLSGVILFFIFFLVYSNE